MVSLLNSCKNGVLVVLEFLVIKIEWSRFGTYELKNVEKNNEQ